MLTITKCNIFNIWVCGAIDIECIYYRWYLYKHEMHFRVQNHKWMNGAIWPILSLLSLLDSIFLSPATLHNMHKKIRLIQWIDSNWNKARIVPLTNIINKKISLSQVVNLTRLDIGCQSRTQITSNSQLFSFCINQTFCYEAQRYSLSVIFFSLKKTWFNCAVLAYILL